MSFHRTLLVASIGLVAATFASAAFAQCGSCGGQITYVQPAPQPVYVQPPPQLVYVQQAPQPVYVPQPTCGGCGCGGCASVAPVPIAAAPIAVDHWDTGGYGGCGGGCGCNSCGGTFGYRAVASSPLYVVNQGPDYSGPGLMQPYGTYSPETDVSNPAEYPYASGPGYGYGHRFAHPYYRARFAGHPHYWHHYGYPHRWRG
jgi:hypothetical protein